MRDIFVLVLTAILFLIVLVTFQDKVAINRTKHGITMELK